MKDFQKLLSKIFTSKLFALLLLIGAVGVTIYVYQNPDTDITKLLNSNYFVGLVTAGAGTVAFLVYFKQKSDTKRDASKTIFAEMKKSEEMIRQLKNMRQYSDSGQLNLGLDPMKYYLGNLSWDKYKYLFIGDFGSYEWEKINLYFSQCVTLNQTIQGIADLLPQNIEYRTQFTQEFLAKIAYEQANEISELELPDEQETAKTKDYQESVAKIAKKYKQKTDDFIVGYIEGELTPMRYIYNPKNNYVPLERELDKIDSEISESSIGKKLKELSS